MKSKDYIINLLTKMSGKYSPYEIFYDWVKLSALSIQNACSIIHDEVWRKREEDYISIARKYEQEELRTFQECFVTLGNAYEERIEDVLGEVYMRSGCYNKNLGQFFTPFHLAELNAAIAMPEDICEEKIIDINEPSVGGGANIIAYAYILKSRGINYQKIMRVCAQDLDWLAVYMSYLQFSLLGIDARVAQGDTLMNPFNGYNYHKTKVFMTPKHVGALL